MTNGYAETSLVRSSGRYGWLGVEVFFVLSGFIIPYAMYAGGYTISSGWKTFIAKRLLRIEPPYLASILLIFALWHASSLAPGFKGTPPPEFFTVQTASHIGYLTGIFGYPWLNVVFWTLAIEFQFYLIVSLVFGWLRNSDKYAIYLIDFSLLVSSLILSSEVFVFKYFGLFVFGISAFQYRTALIDGRAMIFMLLAAGIVVSVVLGWKIALVGLLTSALMVSNMNFGKHKMLLWLGSISYSLYLVHVPVGGRVVNLGKRYVESQAGEALLSIIALFVSLAFAYIFYLTIEKPSQNWAKNRQYLRVKPNKIFYE